MQAPPSYDASTGAAPAPQGLNASNAVAYLTRVEWPIGLQNTFLREVAKVPLRFIIVDDSGSMASSDGHRLVGEGSKRKLISATRWAELGDGVRFHAQFAEASGAVTQFRLLNAAQPLILGRGDDDGMNLRTLMALMDGSPSGGTPLCMHIRAVTQEILQMSDFLRSTGQKATLTICTDGESSDGDVAAALQPLAHLPVSVIIRLCTDEERIVDYWNRVDESIELALDILDDAVGEAREIHKVNPWLNYGDPMHRAREFGVTIKELDLIDEKKLNADQIWRVVPLILGGEKESYPHPDVDWSAFERAIENANHAAPRVWSPVKNGSATWIDVPGLRAHLHKGGACIIS